MFKRFASWSDGNASFLRAARAGNLDKVLEYLKGSTDINTSNANGLNALHLASKEGHVNIVTELLSRGANVDAATKKGNTALHIASLAGQEEIVKILVKHGAKVNVQSQNGFTPLYMAAQENHSDVVKFLLANGASQSLATEDGFTPLAVALQQGHDKVVAVLLENDTRGKVRLPALHIAAKKDDVKAATLLLQSDHNVDGVSKSGFTPLHIAAHYGNINVGSLLIEKGADTNFKARNNITPLHVSSKWGRSNMVTLLLDSGAQIDGRTRDGLTPLHCAARSGHEQVVDLLLERGAPVGSKTKNGLSPLHMSAQGDHVDCARLILFHKAPINDVTVDYLTPLHVAAHCGNVRTAKLLLDRKCEVNARALNGFTPLHIACKKNRIKVVELLLKYGASIEATTESGLTPLHVASFMGHMNIVIYLIQHGANPDTPTVRGETALHLAARANQTDIIRILLRNGAQVDAKAREQQTPLHIAARLGNVDNVVLLLQHGASPDATTKDLYTPLHIAAKEGHEEVASVLLEHGASQNLTTKKGFTPLHIAAKYGNIKVARLLLQKEADPNVQGKNGLTPLHVATHYNNVNVALLLLENGASPHCTAKNGYTPLHIAAKKNQMDIATTLLEYGAKPNSESKNGFTPLHLASQEGHTDMVSLLLEHGANVNCTAKNGLTPMHLAAQEDKVPVAEILVKYGSEIDPQTKAGYTPLHTACHFGQINMIRYLLEHNASVNATTKLGYTPLHQAAQQGHVLVINLLLKYKASPNAVTNTGQTPLSIAQRLGYISVVEILKHITEVQTTPAAGDEKYKVVSPETMQETLMTDSEDEGGVEELIPPSPLFSRPLSEQHVYLPTFDAEKQRKARSQDWGEDSVMVDQSMSVDDMKFLVDDSITPARKPDIKKMDEFKYDRYSTTTSTYSASGYGQDDYRYMLDESGMHGAETPVFDDSFHIQEEKLTTSAAPELHGAYPGSKEAMGDKARPAIYGSYSGASFSSSFDPDNIALDRHPIYSGFLVSFMVDARGGAMRGCRHSGVRIIVPPGKACMPTRVTCKLVKKEKLMHPPPLMEGEALASRILEMGPVGAKFLGPVILEVPHFASLRGKEREIVVLRSDNGETWREHIQENTEEAIHDALDGSFEDLESAEELYNKRITRILTTDFPQYFAVVTRIRQETKSIGPEAGMLSSTVVPQVQAVFPEGSLTKKIKVGLQAQPIQPELLSKMLGNRVAVSPIVTVEPRRRKFHKPITLTIPLPKASQKGMINQYGTDAPTLRLLCSITGGASPAQWEDITGTTPLTFVNDCVSFTTTVSARFWLMDCQNINEAAKMATELYREAIAVPFMAKFVVFGKRYDPMESRLRVFCMTDDRMDKTLETQEHFTEIARSRDVEVLDGKPQYIEMAGNLVPVTKSGDQLFINFHSFRENRLPYTVRVRDTNQEAVGRLAFMKEPKVGRGEAPQNPICNLNISLPSDLRGESAVELDTDTAQELRRKYEMAKGGSMEEQISKAELRLTDIADTLQGDWVMLARQLNISEEEITKIQTEYTYVSEQALVMLHLWVQKSENNATGMGNELERALRKIGREDVIRKCMYNIEEVTDENERAVAKVHIDQEGFQAFKEDLGPSRDAGMQRGLSLDVSYDEHDLMKESESVEGSGSETGSVVEREEKARIAAMKKAPRPVSIEEEQFTAEIDERRGVVKSPTAEEAEFYSQQKKEAYISLTRQMQDEIEVETYKVAETVEQEPTIKEDEILQTMHLPEPVPLPIEECIEKVEGAQVHGMDDRISVSSEEGVIPAVVPRKEVKDDADVTKKPEHVVAHTKTITPPPSPTDKATPESLFKDTKVGERFVYADGQKSPADTLKATDIYEYERFIKQSRAQDVSEAELAQRLADTETWHSETITTTTSSQGPEVLKRPLPKSTAAGHEQIKEASPTHEEIIPMLSGDTHASFGQEGMIMQQKAPPAQQAPAETDIYRQEVHEDYITMTETNFAEKGTVQSGRPRISMEDEPEVRSRVSMEEDEIVPDVNASAHRPKISMEDDIEPEDGGTGFMPPSSPLEDYDEIEETLPDGTIVKRRIIRTKVKKMITKKIRRVGPDGEVIEDVITEEVPESELSETSSLHSSLSDARDIQSPVPSISSPAELASPSDSIDSERPTVRVYTDTVEGEPQIETDVQEFEETLEDGTVVKRKVIKTRQRQTVVKRVVMEGPEADLPTTEEQAQLMINASHVYEPEMRVYTDRYETEPEASTDVQEFEETQADGSVVKRKVTTTTEQQLRTERTVMEGSGQVPGLTEESRHGHTRHQAIEEAVTAQLASEVQRVPVQEDLIEPELKEPVQRSSAAFMSDEDMDDDIETMLAKARQVDEVESPQALPEPVREDDIVPEFGTHQAKPATVEEPVVAASRAEDTHAAPPMVDIPDDNVAFEEMPTSPSTFTSEGTMEFEDAQESWDLPREEEGISTSSSEMARVDDVRLHKESAISSQEAGAEGGDLQTTRVVMKKQVHKKTIVKDGKEETIITEDTQVSQDNEGPEELRDSMQEIIDQFMEGKGPAGDDPPQQS